MSRGGVGSAHVAIELLIFPFWLAASSTFPLGKPFQSFPILFTAAVTEVWGSLSKIRFIISGLRATRRLYFVTESQTEASADVAP